MFPLEAGPRRYAVIALGLMVAGVVLFVLEERVAAMAIGGLGAVIAAAIAFYAIGRSEDLDRERGRG